MPKTTTLSAAALSLLQLHLERHGELDVDDTNREEYRELERAGIVAIGHSLREGRDSIYRLTKEGFERKAELLACAKESGVPIAPLHGKSAVPRR